MFYMSGGMPPLAPPVMAVPGNAQPPKTVLMDKSSRI